MVQAPPAEIIRAALPQLRSFLLELQRVRPPRGTGITSWYRDPSHNAAVGGSPESQHLFGLAIDVVVPEGERQSLLNELAQVAVFVVEYERHIHVQAGPVGFLAQSGLIERA